jgi:hypothetical protein
MGTADGNPARFFAAVHPMQFAAYVCVMRPSDNDQAMHSTRPHRHNKATTAPSRADIDVAIYNVTV